METSLNCLVSRTVYISILFSWCQNLFLSYEIMVVSFLWHKALGLEASQRSSVTLPQCYHLDYQLVDQRQKH